MGNTELYKTIEFKGINNLETFIIKGNLYCVYIMNDEYKNHYFNKKMVISKFNGIIFEDYDTYLGGVLGNRK